jgi:Tol biopolymer transport system component
MDHPGDISGCEIYIMTTEGKQITRLTDNDYCDFQPRWGP